MVAQTGYKGRGLPIAERCRSHASATLGGTSIVPRQVGRGPSFVNKYQLFEVHPRLRFTPGAARCLHVLALLLAGVQGFF